MEQVENALVLRFTKMGELAKELLFRHGVKTVNLVRVDFLKCALLPAVAVARWAHGSCREILQKDRLELAFLETGFESIDGGEWTALVGLLMGKADTETVVHIVGEPKEPVNSCAMPKSGKVVRHRSVEAFLKSDAARSCDAIWIRDVAKGSSAMDVLRDKSIAELMKSGTKVVVCGSTAADVAVGQELGRSLGLNVSEVTENPLGRLNVEGVPTDEALYVWSYEGQSRGVDKQSVDTGYDVRWIEKVFEELTREDVAAGTVPEDPKSTGLVVRLLNSVDEWDKYVTLPRGHAVRLWNGRVCCIDEEGFASHWLDTSLNDQMFRLFPGEEAEWVRRCAWSCQVWEFQIKPSVRRTLGALLNKTGEKQFAEKSVESIRSKLRQSGISDEAIEVFTMATNGSRKRVATLRERMLFHKIANGSAEEVEALMADAEFVRSARNEDHQNALVALITRGDLGLIEMALVAGVHPRQLDGKLQTAMHFAAAVGSRECLALLLRYGAVINEWTPLKWTPLHVATARGAWANAEALLDMGALASLRNIQGATAADLADSEKVMGQFFLGGADSAHREFVSSLVREIRAHFGRIPDKLKEKLRKAERRDAKESEALSTWIAERLKDHPYEDPWIEEWAGNKS